MASSPESRREMEEYLARGNRTDSRPVYNIVQPRKTTAKMQRDLARNLLIGFLVLIIVIISAVIFYDVQFCRDAPACGENFVSLKVIIDTLLDFGSPFMGIIIGFFFSEKFRGNRKEE